MMTKEEAITAIESIKNDRETLSQSCEIIKKRIKNIQNGNGDIYDVDKKELINIMHHRDVAGCGTLQPEFRDGLISAINDIKNNIRN